MTCWSTHDIDEAMYPGDRVIVIADGLSTVRVDLPVALPHPRDQITTRELRARLPAGRNHPPYPPSARLA